MAVNRPGFGGSIYQAGRTMADWSGDAVAVADHLGIDRMSVLGFSGGGPFALSCGVERPDRFRGVGVVSGATPIDRPAARAAMPPSDRALSVLSLRAPVLARAVLWVTAATARFAPSLALRSWRMELSAADRRELDTLGLAPAQTAGFLVDGMRHGARGALHDYRLLSEPWGFTASDVTVPVWWWHGAEDATVPVGEARRLVAALPHGTLAEVTGGGHLLLRRLGAEIASTLVGH